MFVDIGNVCHDLLPVRPLYADHVRELEDGGDAHRLGCVKGNREVTTLLVSLQGAVRNLVWDISMQERAEGHSVIPRRREVGDVYFQVALGLTLTPLEESVPFTAPVLDESSQGVKTDTVRVVMREWRPGLLNSLV